MLLANQRRTRICGGLKVPVCEAAASTRELDYLIIKASPFQLESTLDFHPSVAVLTNLAPDDLDHFASVQEYLRANARLFQNQQSFDWAIVQSEALTSLREIGAPVPAKVITFSATDSQADLHLERGLLISRLPDWEGPLLNLEQCSLRGPHNAENLMAALAVGRVLRLPLDRMTAPLKEFHGGPHRCELVAEIEGVQFVDDSAARNSHALRQALHTARPGFDNHPNIILIAGGRDRGIEYHDLGPVLAQRVKQAFLLGPVAEKMRAAWSLFTPCAGADSLLEAVSDAAKMAVPGDVVLLSPACSSADLSQNDKTRGAAFCVAVNSIDRGAQCGHHKITDRESAKGVHT
jgi:UDP-N-acetylmuramoylalanine--D-glutamate ligase